MLIRTLILALLLCSLASCSLCACSKSSSEAYPSFVKARAIDVIHGKVSYYHDSLAGNKTANGEIYELDEFTAASRTLPFHTIVRVTRTDTGKSVIVRINDRGPFGSKKRILDLSRAAAEELGMIRRGVVKVRAEILRRGR